MNSSQALRVIFSGVCGRANLANSTCTRTLSTDGSIFELVHLDGSDKGLTDADLGIPAKPSRGTFFRLVERANVAAEVALTGTGGGDDYICVLCASCSLHHFRRRFESAISMPKRASNREPPFPPDRA